RFSILYFLFQAEDGIRDRNVTGVQTCALPISIPSSFLEGEDKKEVIAEAEDAGVSEVLENDDGSLTYKMSKSTHKEMMGEIKTRSEERRVGKGCRCRWGREAGTVVMGRRVRVI